ncbi:MAG: hypothetical protein HDT16_06570 [Oscillibacter sp.]|nr:hypothetical protein [Oscillibacter sp.]
MNWTIFVIECVVLMAVFGCLVFGMLLANPLTFISDYPPEIQERYYRSQHKEASKAVLTKLMVVKKVTALIVCAFLFAWMAHTAGAVTFLEGPAYDLRLHPRFSRIRHLRAGLAAVSEY